ncbi:trypsin-like serine protease [Vibrio parahaemolyticus]|nr:trypsin-like serine protease [Vibrio parahaemolyticus]EJG1086412.1 trypsin-like serine protease [Vibrio parahaemolyticus]EJS4016492.1 trypsin-like serine protease [Vibrio parahaemolyticus]
MRFSSLPLIVLGLLSLSSYAVENGTPVDWSQQDNAVRFDSRQTGRQGLCTGTLVAGRYVLTAAHCLVESELDSFTTASGSNYSSSHFVNHDNFVEDDGFSGEDIGIITADEQIDYHHIQFLNIGVRTESEAIYISGFGGTIDTLNKADFTFAYYYPNLYDPEHIFAVYANITNDSHTVPGDSGATWINQGNEIVAIHKGSAHYTSGERKTYGTDIQAVKDFITDNIDAWHYPTLVDTDENGKATITIQSLHPTGTSGFAYTDGENTTLINEESTCFTKGQIQPFEKCTYVIESNGEEGELYLTDNEVIHINKPIENTGGGDSGNNNTDNDDNGGSMGFWSLLLLGVATLRRKR